MKSNKKNILYFFLLIVVLGVAYTASKDITPVQEHIESTLDLKLNK